jgi:hypothetical protein
MAASKGRRTRPTQTHQNDATGADVAAPGTDTVSRADNPAGAVWDALTANPGSAVATIAIAARVSKTVARRELAALEKGGQATRTKSGRDGGKPTPDTWAPAGAAATAAATGDSPDGAASDTAPTVGTPDDASTGSPDDAAPDADEATSATESSTAEDDPNGGDDGEDHTSEQNRSDEGMDPAAVADAREVLTAMRDVITSALDALDAGDGGKADAAAEIVYGASGKARRLVRTAARGRPRTASGQAKFAPGQLRAKVAAHLAAFPGKEFTPHEIGKAINHSAGAVANALEKLVALDEAVCTNERPRRFTSTTDSAATDTTDESADGDAVATAS